MSNFYFGNRCSGLCNNDKDDDCDGPGNTCGCPTGFDWWGPPTNKCIFIEFDCGVPPSNCDTVPYQTACIRLDFPNPFAPTQACCVFGSYGGTTYYDWDTAHITTY